jgi:hypothetical protein
MTHSIYFDGNVLGVIRSFLPNSLNVSLVCKSFYQSDTQILTKVKHVDDLPWLMSQTKYDFSSSATIMQLTLENAAYRGNMEWLRKNNNKARKFLPSLVDKAVQAGQITVLEWVYKLRHPLFDESSRDGNNHVMNMAAKHGRMDVLQWALKIHCQASKEPPIYPKHITSFAVLGKSIPILAFLHTQSITWCQETTFLAIQSNQRDVIDWLHEHGRLSLTTFMGSRLYDYEKTSTQHFAWYGTEEEAENMIRYSTVEDLNKYHILEIIGLNHNTNIVQKKRLLLQCLIKGATNWNDFMYDIVTSEDKSIAELQDMAEWAIAHGCPWDASLTYHMFAKVTRQNYEQHRERVFHFLQWAIRHGCPWDEGTIYEIDTLNDDELMDWALANGCPDFSSDIESESDD